MNQIPIQLSGGGTSSIGIETHHPKTVIDFKIGEDTVTITYLQRALYRYIEDKVFKHVYGVVDGKLELILTITGRIIPPNLEETYVFDEE